MPRVITCLPRLLGGVEFLCKVICDGADGMHALQLRYEPLKGWQIQLHVLCCTATVPELSKDAAPL